MKKIIVYFTLYIFFLSAQLVLSDTSCDNCFTVQSIENEEYKIALFEIDNYLLEEHIGFYVDEYGNFYIPIEALLNELYLEAFIHLDKDSFQIKMGNKSYLKFENKKIFINDKEFNYSGNNKKILKDDWDFYLPVELFDNFFKLSFIFDELNSILFIMAEDRSLIPFLMFQDVKKRRESIVNYQNKYSDKRDIYIDSDDNKDDFFLSPSLDFSTDAQFIDSQFYKNIYSNIDFHTKHANVNIFYQRSNEEKNKYFTFEGDLDNQFYSEYEFGDIFIDNGLLIFPSMRSKGVQYKGSISKNDFSDESVTTIRGKSAPGNEAELYHEGLLVASKSVENDGFFEFQDVKMNIGKNSYDVIVYDSYGEKTTYEYTRIHGIFEYTHKGFSQYQMFDVSTNDELDSKLRHLEIKGSILPNNSSGISLSQIKNKNSSTNYISFSSFIVDRNKTFYLKYAFSNKGKKAYSLSNILNISQKVFLNSDFQYFDSEYYSLSNKNNLKYLFNQTISYQWDGLLDFIDIKLSKFKLRDVTNQEYTLGFRKNINKMYFYDRVVFNSNGFHKNEMGFSSYRNKAHIRGSSIFYNNNNHMMMLSLQRKIQNFNASFEFFWNSGVDDMFTGKSIFSKKMKYGDVNIALQMNSKSKQSLLLGWKNKKIIYDHLKEKIEVIDLKYHDFMTIIVDSYYDDNNNGKKDANEEGIPGVSFLGHKGISDRHGILSLYVPLLDSVYRLVIDDSSLHDPFSMPKYEVIHLLSKSGGIRKVNYPIYRVSSIHVKLDDCDEKNTVILLDKQSNKIIQHLITEDIFFVFDFLLPGKYEILLMRGYQKHYEKELVSLKKEVNLPVDAISEVAFSCHAL